MSSRRSYLRYLPVAVGALVVVVVTIGMVTFIRGMLDESPKAPKKTVQQITFIKPPPPPPPELEKPPEPELEEKVEVPEPEAVDDAPEPVAGDEPPAGDLLGLDADGGLGADGFGLLAKKGGRSFIGSGDNISKYAWYTSTVQRDIHDALSGNKNIRADHYEVTIKLWLAEDGSVTRFEIVESTANPQLENKLRMAFADLEKLSERPPSDIPQPIKLRITSKL